MKKLISLMMILFSLNAHAQAGDTGDGDGLTSDVPVDGGLSLLLTAGADYGMWQVSRRKQVL